MTKHLFHDFNALILLIKNIIHYTIIANFVDKRYRESIYTLRIKLSILLNIIDILYKFKTSVEIKVLLLKIEP